MNLAVMDAEPYADGNLDVWGHAVWHAFLPILRDGDAHQWANDLETLVPIVAYYRDVLDPGRANLYHEWLAHFHKIVQILKLMTPGPIYGCERCY